VGVEVGVGVSVSVGVGLGRTVGVAVSTISGFSGRLMPEHPITVASRNANHDTFFVFIQTQLSAESHRMSTCDFGDMHYHII
jgi:hypothetical protein